ncbi:glycosyl hydrolase family 28-related protein, partial [Bacteroidota bacterium]
MRFRLLLFISFYFPGLFLTGFTQTLPLERSVDWTLAGLRDTTSNNFQKIDMQAFGAVGDGLTPNDIIMSSVLSSNLGSGAILEFPTGNFLFNYTIDLPSNIIIRGQGAESTILTMNLNGFGHAINVQGISIGSDTTSLVQTAIKDSSFIIVLSPNNFTAGNWIQIIQQ